MGFAVQKNVIEKAPKIELLPGESRRERVITPAHESAYLAKCTPLLRDVFTVLGIRWFRKMEIA